LSFFFKLGLLTCGFYAALTIVLDAALVAAAHLWAVGFRTNGPGLTLGAKYGVIFGVLWLISFSAARWIVYSGLKERLSVLPN
jgi:hypothetical protein